MITTFCLLPENTVIPIHVHVPNMQHLALVMSLLRNIELISQAIDIALKVLRGFGPRSTATDK